MSTDAGALSGAAAVRPRRQALIRRRTPGPGGSSTGRRSLRPGPAARRSLSTWATAYTFVLPVLALTLIFSIIPLILVVRRSLYNGNIFGTHLSFVGLGNYRGVFANGGGHILVVTAEFTIGFVGVSMLVGLIVALLLDVPLRGFASVRAVFIIPVVAPPVAAALIWSTLFQPQTGFINRILSDLGLPQTSLSGTKTALIAVIAFGAWQFFGEVVILYLAGLKGMPMELIEAASIDGAGAWSRLRFIRLPLLRRQTALIGVLATLTGLQTFTQIDVLTNGGPNGATTTVLFFIYQQGSQLPTGSVGQADAMGVILFGISLVVTAVQVAVIGRSVTGSK